MLTLVLSQKSFSSVTCIMNERLVASASFGKKFYFLRRILREHSTVSDAFSETIRAGCEKEEWNSKNFRGKSSAVAFWLWQTIAKDRFAIVVLLSVLYQSIFIPFHSGIVSIFVANTMQSNIRRHWKNASILRENLSENELINPLHVFSCIINSIF